MQQSRQLPSALSDPPPSLPLSAWICVDSKCQPCFVVDLTADGARVHCAKPPAAGATIELRLTDQETLRAEVAWQSGSRMGLKFAPLNRGLHS